MRGKSVPQYFHNSFRVASSMKNGWKSSLRDHEFCRVSFVECNYMDLCLSQNREIKNHSLTPYYSGKMCTAIERTHMKGICTEPRTSSQ